MEQLLGVASALQRRRRSEETAIRLHRMRQDIRVYPHIYVTVPVEALGRPSRTIADRLGRSELNRGGLIDATDPGRLQGGIESLRGGAVRTCRDSSSVRGRTLADNVPTGATCATPPAGIPNTSATFSRDTASFIISFYKRTLALTFELIEIQFIFCNCLYEIFYRLRFHAKQRNVSYDVN